MIRPRSAYKKKGVGMVTDKYGSLANSSGQDNLGQILMAVFSFEKLKENVGNEKGYHYNGGILLIDEIDATLHPVAQNKLFDFLCKKAKELDLQIVFTTHSLSLIEHIIRNKELSDKNTSCVVQYFKNSRGKIEIDKNPSKKVICNDLLLTYSGIGVLTKINVLTEDDTARWFLKQILTYNGLNLIEGEFGFTDMTKLIVSSSLFKDCLVIYDQMFLKKWISWIIY